MEPTMIYFQGYVIPKSSICFCKVIEDEDNEGQFCIALYTSITDPDVGPEVVLWKCGYKERDDAIKDMKALLKLK